MKIKNRYFETLAKVQPLLQKEFSAKTSFHLARLFSKIETESKIYFAEKQKLVEKYAKRDTKGEIVSSGDSVTLENPGEFTQKLEEILSIEIDLGLDTIEIDFDNEPKLTIEEMMILLPFIKEV
jgi:hypothetical protein